MGINDCCFLNVYLNSLSKGFQNFLAIVSLTDLKKS